MRRASGKTSVPSAPLPAAPPAAAWSPGAANAALINGIRSRFGANRDAANAGPMQAYMKSTLPFYGINAPLRRRLTADAVREHPCGDVASLGATMEALWRGAQFREERYAAQEMARVGPHRKLPLLALLPLYEEMIVTGAWWDHCDDISGNALPALLNEALADVQGVIRRWARRDDLWLRRAAILSQRRLKGAADAALLYECIEASVSDARFAREFFIAKGVGWALRERSYTHPDEVRTYVQANAARLAKLTQREALKAINRRNAKRAAAPSDSDGDSD